MTRVFLDTSPLIYLAEGAPERRGLVLQQLTQWIEANAMLCTSTLTLLELLVVPKREKDHRLERKYRALLNTFLSEPLIGMDADIAVLAAEYRADLGLRTPDAVQLATAVHHGYELFYTNDRRLQRCTDIELLMVDQKR